MPFRLRPLESGDTPFLELMVVAAADWNPANAKGERHWRADPMMEKYVGVWRENSDFGFLVEDGGPIGAVWMRYFTASNPGYGFVDEQTPELSIGVLEGFRGQGVGRALLQAAMEAAPDRLSLSVEDGNRAIHLYGSFGFKAVGREGNSTTMIWERELPASHS